MKWEIQVSGDTRKLKELSKSLTNDELRITMSPTPTNGTKASMVLSGRVLKRNFNDQNILLKR